MSVRKGQARLLKIAKLLESKSPIPADYRAFLVTALKEISDGGDAEAALEVKAKRGERKSKHARDAKHTLHFIYGWIAAAILPPDEDGLGLGLSVNEACIKISDITFLHLQLAPETIRRYWDENKSKYDPSFPPPPAD
jgi:hypothetical protein